MPSKNSNALLSPDHHAMGSRIVKVTTPSTPITSYTLKLHTQLEWSLKFLLSLDLKKDDQWVLKLELHGRILVFQ